MLVHCMNLWFWKFHFGLQENIIWKLIGVRVGFSSCLLQNKKLSGLLMLPEMVEHDLSFSPLSTSLFVLRRWRTLAAPIGI